MKKVDGRNGGKINQWEAGESGNPKGRPRKFISTVKREGFSRSEVEECLKVMLSLTIDELKEVFLNDSATVLEKTIAKSLHKDLNGGKLDTVETLLNRSYGKPVTHSEITGSNGTPLIPINLVIKDNDTRDALERLQGNEND